MTVNPDLGGGDMSSPKACAPRPGRPKGSGLDDSKTLARMAALLASGEETTVAGAARRAGADNDATIRRLQRKFAERQEDLMEAHQAASELCAEETERKEKRLNRLRTLLIVSLLSSTLGATALFGLAGLFLTALMLPIASASAVLLSSDKPERITKVGRIVNRTLLSIVRLLSWSVLSIPLWPNFSQWSGTERMVGWLAVALGLSIATSDLWGLLVKRGKSAKHPRSAFAFGSLAGGMGMIGALALPAMLVSIGVLSERLEERAALLEATTSVLKEEFGVNVSKRVAQRLSYVILLTAVDQSGADTDSYGEWLSSVACTFRGNQGCAMPAIERIRTAVPGSIDYAEAGRVASEKALAAITERKKALEGQPEPPSAL